MKRFYIIFITAICCVFIISCGERNRFEEGTYETPMDSLLIHCAGLKGIGGFNIGMSRKAALNHWEKHRKKVPVSWWFNPEPQWASGYWGIFYGPNKEELVAVTKSIKHSKNYVVNGNILGVKRNDAFLIGDIEPVTMDLAFYDNILVAVHAKFENCKTSEEVYNHYIELYGQGIGQYSMYFVENGKKGDKYSCEFHGSNERSWKNEKVTLECIRNYEGKIGPDGIQNIEKSQCELVAYSEAGYEKFKEEIAKARDDFKNPQPPKEPDIKKSLNQL